VPVGVNVTSRVQAAAGARTVLPVQVVVGASAKSPVMLRAEMARGAVPELVKITGLAVLVVPTFRLANMRDVALSFTLGCKTDIVILADLPAAKF